MNKLGCILLICLGWLWLCSHQSATPLFPKPFPKPIYDLASNPLQKDVIDLGRRFFYDPILSKNNTISCASCHSPYNAFAHVDHALSHGIYDRIGYRNAPALFNVAWAPYFMQDGAIHHLDMQALAPISDSNEMQETFDHVISKINADTSYKILFKKVYHQPQISGAQFLKAMAQFLLSLVSAESKYDSVMRGKASFSQQEKKGYLLFQKHCANCHQEPLFTNYTFVNNGIGEDQHLHDLGRYRVTKDSNDLLKFKVPSLRNIEFTAPYMHDGRFASLKDVLRFYASPHPTQANTDNSVKHPFPLSAIDQVDILAFLLCLSDKHFIFNPQHAYPKSMLKN